MATKKQFDAEINRWDAAVDSGDASDFDYVIQVWSPKGKVWTSTGSHVLARQFRNSCESWKPDAYRELIEEMRDGVEVCSDKDCEFCHE